MEYAEITLLELMKLRQQIGIEIFKRLWWIPLIPIGLTIIYAVYLRLKK